MSIIRSTQYPGRWNTPDSDAPQGSGKNRTSPTSNDGSYFDQVWFDDMDSLHQALFISSGITPNGTQDVGTASQIFDALVNKRWSAIGNYSVGTIVTASNGKQYYCNQANGRDISVVDPITDALDIWRQYPYELVSNSNGKAKKFYDGSLEQRGTIESDVQTSTVTLPVPFVDTSYQKMAIDTGTEGINTSFNCKVSNSISSNVNSFTVWRTQVATGTLVASIDWFANGEWA